MHYNPLSGSLSQDCKEGEGAPTRTFLEICHIMCCRHVLRASSSGESKRVQSAAADPIIEVNILAKLSTKFLAWLRASAHSRAHHETSIHEGFQLFDIISSSIKRFSECQPKNSYVLHQQHEAARLIFVLAARSCSESSSRCSAARGADTLGRGP